MLARRLLIGGAFVLHGLTPDGIPATVLADGSFNSQPGIAWLDATRALVVFQDSSLHIRGIIGTVTSTTPWTFSWGTAFTIMASPTNAYDPVSVVDNKVVVTGNVFSGGTTNSPFIIISDDAPAAFTSGSTWGAPINLPPRATPNDITNGPVQKLGDGTYLVSAQIQNPSYGNGVFKSTSLTVWSAATMTAIGIAAGALLFTEIVVVQKASGNLVAHLRTETPKTRYASESSDYGATWSAPASAFSGYGFPMFSILDSSLLLATYRQTVAGEGMPYWRQSADGGTTWSGETLLDGTLIGGQPSYDAYSTHLRLDATHVLVVYSIGDQRGAAYPANLYSQVFTET